MKGSGIACKLREGSPRTHGRQSLQFFGIELDGFGVELAKVTPY